MLDLLEWLVTLFGHWQHWAGGAALGLAVVLTAAGLERMFGRSMTVRSCVLLFGACFLADASFMAWREGRPAAVVAPPISALPAPSPVVVAMPEAGAAPVQVLPGEVFSRDRALAFSNEIMRFYVSRDIMQPRPLRTGLPGTPEWDAVEAARSNYQRDTVTAFRDRFGSDLLLLLERLKEQHIETGGIEIMYRELDSPQGIKNIWIRLSSISKE